MSHQFSEAEKEKPKKFSDLFKVGGKPKESYQQYRDRIAQLRRDGKLRFKDLIRIA